MGNSDEKYFMKAQGVIIPRLNLTSKEHAVDSNNVIARAFY